MSERALIGVDWGSSNLRAFRYDAEGRVVETRRAACGMNAVRDRDFEGALAGVVGDWLGAGEARIVVSGMAGAREGWVEAPYLPCPANLSALAANLAPAPTRLGEAWIVPGLTCEAGDGLRDAMRGEETQIMGAIDAEAPRLAIAPGTHSKWARIEARAVASIRTYMTGDAFAALKSHTILARLIEGEAHDDAAFALGLARARDNRALLNVLFSVRTEGLFGAIAPGALASYLSGLLIGSEIADGLAQFGADLPILVIGAADIAALYERALAAGGAQGVSIIDGEGAAARGLARIAEARKL